MQHNIDVHCLDMLVALGSLMLECGPYDQGSHQNIDFNNWINR